MKKYLMVLSIILSLIGCIKINEISTTNSISNILIEDTYVQEPQNAMRVECNGQYDELAGTKADNFYIEELIYNYVHNRIEAINNNDFSMIEDSLLEDSDFFSNQKEIVSQLHRQKVQQKLLDYEIKNIEEIDQENYKVYVYEYIETKYPDKEEKKEHYWIYTVSKHNDRIGLANRVSWDKDKQDN